MTGNNYLLELLASQELKEGCEEIVGLDNERERVDRIIKDAYPNSHPTFTHGGSRAKGTMIREDYDLDGHCHSNRWLGTGGPYSVPLWISSHTAATAFRASSSSRRSGSISASL